MIEGIPRISVLVITYKQQDIVGRTLDSLLAQKDYLYEICLSDDCSPDNTWQVLLNYQKQYPDLIKLNRNNPNVGIFENTERTWEMPSGDIIYTLAGDDKCGEGWLKRVVEFVLENKIDYKNELFCIYSDFKAVYPNGDSLLFRQKAIAKHPNSALRLALRGIICGRGCCFSINVLKKFEKVSEGRSHKVEHVQDRQLQLWSEKNYYIPHVGNIYFTNVGVSAHIDEKTAKERYEIWPFTFAYLEKKGIALCKEDIAFGQYLLAAKDFKRKKTVGNFIKALKLYNASKDASLPKERILRRLVFAIRRRLPHNKPIHFE